MDNITIDFNNPEKTGWQYEVARDAKNTDVIEVLDKGVLLTAGGWDYVTHYARIRQQENHVPLDTLITIEAEIELPEDFYSKQFSYMRLMGTDNFTIDKNHTWRVGFGLFSDGYPRLILEHQGLSETILWKGDFHLPLGKNVYQLSINASYENPFTALYINGEMVGFSKDTNVPTKDFYPEQAFLYKQYVGIDGAFAYDKSDISLTVHSINIYEGTPNTGKNGCLNMLFSQIWKIFMYLFG